MNSKTFSLVVVPLSILLPLLIGLIRFRKLSASTRLIFWYLIASAVFTRAALIIGRNYHLNNMPVSHLFTIVELSFIVLFYKKLMRDDKKSNLYTYIILLFTVVCVLNALFFQSIYTYNSYTKSIEAIICILFSLRYFATLAADMSPSAIIMERSGFYFNAGFFLYFSGAFMLFVFSNFIITNLSSAGFTTIWTIHAGLVLIMYLLFSLGFLLCKK